MAQGRSTKKWTRTRRLSIKIPLSLQDMWDKNPEATLLVRDKAIENSMKKNQYHYYKVRAPTVALCLGTYGDSRGVGVSYERGNRCRPCTLNPKPEGPWSNEKDVVLAYGSEGVLLFTLRHLQGCKKLHHNACTSHTKTFFIVYFSQV